MPGAPRSIAATVAAAASSTWMNEKTPVPPPDDRQAAPAHLAGEVAVRRVRRARPVEEAVAQHEPVDAVGARDGVLELVQRLDAARPRPRRVVPQRVVLGLRRVAGGRVGERDALRDHAPRARRDAPPRRGCASPRCGCGRCRRPAPPSCADRGWAAGRSARARPPRDAPPRPPHAAPSASKTSATTGAAPASRSAPSPIGAPRHRRHLVSGLDQHRKQAAPDHSGRPGDEDPHAGAAAARGLAHQIRRTRASAAAG